MIAKLAAFGRFWYDFIIGDDWLVAAGVAVAFAATWAVSRTGAAAWWVVPTVVAGLLPLSLWRAIRR